MIQDNKEIALSKKEAIFLELLIKNRNSVTTKQNIAELIQENKIMSESALKNFLLRIRKKGGKDLFFTNQNIGYRLQIVDQSSIIIKFSIIVKSIMAFINANF